MKFYNPTMTEQKEVALQTFPFMQAISAVNEKSTINCLPKDATARIFGYVLEKRLTVNVVNNCERYYANLKNKTNPNSFFASKAETMATEEKHSLSAAAAFGDMKK